MNVIRYPEKDSWNEITTRPHLDISQLTNTVNEVLNEVRVHGDDAVKTYEEKFDHVRLSDLAVSKEEIEED